VSVWYLVKPGSDRDVLKHFMSSHLQTNRDYQATSADKEPSSADHVPDADDADGGRYDNTYGPAAADVEEGGQDPQADDGAGGGGRKPSSGVNGAGSHLPDDRPSHSSSGGDSHMPPPKTAPVSGRGSKTSTRPRASGPHTKCRSVPVVYSGETVVRLGQICYQVQVPDDGSS